MGYIILIIASFVLTFVFQVIRVNKLNNIDPEQNKFISDDFLEERKKENVYNDQVPNIPKNHIEINIDEFLDKHKTSIPQDLFIDLLNMREDEYSKTHISKVLYDKICKESRKKDIDQFKRTETSLNNDRGILFESKGEIDNAIMVYEQSVHHKLPISHAYDRLLVLYRKKKQYKNELRIAELALDVFMQENENRAEKAMLNHPELRDDIMLALETNETFKKEGIVIFAQYDTMKYISRIEKIKKKMLY